MAAAPFPSWVMMEYFVFRRDDDESFPDDSKAPIRATGATSWNAPLRLAFCLAEPPLVSRLYAQFPGFPDPKEQRPLAIQTAHCHLFLFRVGTCTPALGGVVLQDFFVYNANDPSSLIALPACTEPYPDYSRSGCRLPRRPPGQKEERRLLTVGSTSASLGPADKWNSMRVPILDDVSQLCYWQTDTVIPFKHFLCWIDYYRGILICDVFAEASPAVSFLRFPLSKFPSTHNRSRESSWVYRGASVVDAGRALKFVNLARNDGVGYGPLKPGAGFTITCHTLMTLTPGQMVWNEDYKISSDELWSLNSSECLPRDILMFPQVNIDNPHKVHFLMSDFEWALKKMWVVVINMKTKTVDSFSKYINGKEGLETDDGDLTKKRSEAPMSFLPCEFSKFLQSLS
uniref:DUF1618 domain-containing protein n=1 Tax=Aegilops tauschii TaxID=37682 RepID=R7W0D1_AEGTA